MKSREAWTRDDRGNGKMFANTSRRRDEFANERYRRAMRALVELVFPRACVSCGARDARWLCEPCHDATRWIGDDRCARCGRPGSDAEDCRDCRWLKPAFHTARAAAIYAGPARDALMAFKLGGERRTAAELAKAMARASPGGPHDLIAFVPSTRRSEAARGFNPAEELARALAKILRIPVSRLLRKTRETADQAGLDRAQRRRNQKGAFEARQARDGSDRVLLVDDVFTTGATADACARALRVAGVGKVSVLTFARAI